MIEHSFGLVQQKGQGNLQNMIEYVQAKRRHAISFQIKMCKTPFNQHCKNKVRDKGYQAIGKKDLKLGVRDLKEFFSTKAVTDTTSDSDTTSDTDTTDDSPLLKQAFYISKSVPRQSNRSKWREKSGFDPNMLIPVESNSGKLYKGDVLFFSRYDDELLSFVVIKDHQLTSTDMRILVKNLDSGKEYFVKLEKFLHENDQVVVVPSGLYHIADGEVVFDPSVENLFDSVKNKETVSRIDEEWKSLFDSELSFPLPVKEKKRRKRKGANTRSLKHLR